MPRALPATASDDPYLHADGAEVSPDFQRACVEFFADVVQLFGVPKSLGQIYGLLFASPQPLSFTDIAATLDISRGSTSQGLQALRSLGAVVSVEEGSRERGAGSRNSKPLTSELRSPNSASPGGNRRELFRPEFGLRKLVGGVLRERIEPAVTDGASRMARLRDGAAAAPNATGRKFALARVKQIETWRGQVGLLLPLLKTILGSRRNDG